MSICFSDAKENYTFNFQKLVTITVRKHGNLISYFPHCRTLQRVLEGAFGTGALKLPLSNVAPQYFLSNRNMQFQDSIISHIFYFLYCRTPQRVSEGASGTGVLQLPLSNVGGCNGSFPSRRPRWKCQTCLLHFRLSPQSQQGK